MLFGFFGFGILFLCYDLEYYGVFYFVEKVGRLLILSYVVFWDFVWGV